MAGMVPDEGFFIFTSMNTPGERFNQSVRLADGRVVEFNLDKDGYLLVELYVNDTDEDTVPETIFDKQV